MEEKKGSLSNKLKTTVDPNIWLTYVRISWNSIPYGHEQQQIFDSSLFLLQFFYLFDLTTMRLHSVRQNRNVKKGQRCLEKHTHKRT